ncbi:MAG: hypothetical protein ACP5NZ_00420 [Nanobdellota archaeon]
MLDDKIEKIILNLISDKRFKLLDDKNIVDVWGIGGIAFHEYTELESDNLKILYVKERYLGTVIGEEIKITNKKEAFYVFCGSPILESCLNIKATKKAHFNVDELREYIEKNV